MKIELPASVGLGAGVALVAVIAGGALAFALYKNRERFNPTSEKNLAYTGVNSIGEALTGDKDFTLGGWIYDLFNEDPMKSAPENRRPAIGTDPVEPYPTSHFPIGA